MFCCSFVVTFIFISCNSKCISSICLSMDSVSSMTQAGSLEVDNFHWLPSASSPLYLMKVVRLCDSFTALGLFPGSWWNL